MRLAPLFTDHAVLQRDMPLPVWGIAEPGERVEVRCAGKRAAVVAGRDGRWLLRLPALAAGGPHELVAEAPSGKLVVRDVLVGEVWVCSGQSNMQMTLNACASTPGQVPSDDLETVRMLTVSTPAEAGRNGAVDGVWRVANLTAQLEFSAVGGHFARELHRTLGVPIGVISNAWGGTRIQAWMSREALAQDPLAGEELREWESWAYDTNRTTPRFASMAEWERKGAPQDPGDQGSPRGWARPDFDDSAWSSMPIPSQWQSHGHPGSGVFWFRRAVQVPVAWAGRDLELELGSIDKHDDTFVNGERVGGLGWETPNSWCTPRRYVVPGRLIGADGRVVIAVRARSHVYHGGLTGPARAMALHLPDAPADRVGLAGSWRYTIEHDWGLVMPPEMEWGPGNANSPGVLFDARTSPLIPYAIRGAIWYQGESNASEGAAYRRLMPAMIRDWRRAWGQGDFAFLQVQLANFHPRLDEPGRSDWAELREAQNMALAEPATGIAVAIDIGDANDIHPQRKREVAERLARWALATTYGRGGVPSGPLFTGCTFLGGGAVRCAFRHVGGGLVAHGGALRHFAIAGRDHRFVWAEARIVDDAVVVSSPQVPQPTAVRYAWANNPEGCNLFNREGLPASPFRSDDWPA